MNILEQLYKSAVNNLVQNQFDFALHEIELGLNELKQAKTSLNPAKNLWDGEGAWKLMLASVLSKLGYHNEAISIAVPIGKERIAAATSLEIPVNDEEDSDEENLKTMTILSQSIEFQRLASFFLLSTNIHVEVGNFGKLEDLLPTVNKYIETLEKAKIRMSKMMRISYEKYLGIYYFETEKFELAKKSLLASWQISREVLQSYQEESFNNKFDHYYVNLIYLAKLALADNDMALADDYLKAAKKDLSRMDQNHLGKVLLWITTGDYHLAAETNVEESIKCYHQAKNMLTEIVRHELAEKALRLLNLPMPAEKPQHFYAKCIEEKLNLMEAMLKDVNEKKPAEKEIEQIYKHYKQLTLYGKSIHTKTPPSVECEKQKTPDFF